MVELYIARTANGFIWGSKYIQKLKDTL